jgi:hypothetical protein
MEAKINFKNLANEDKEKIMSRYKELHADKGTVYAWQFDTKNPPSARTFSSEENAKEYEVLKNERLRRWLGDYVSKTTYIIGTEKDYQMAVKNWERDRAKMEAKQYAEHVAKIVDTYQQQIKALETLKSVCRTFDGKVINKRFNEAVKSATGLTCCFEDGCMSLHKYSYAGPYKEIHVYLYYRWYQEMENFWQWKPGDRMEAEKAVSIIDIKINVLQKEIKRIQGTRKNYTKYVAKVRKVEKLIEELSREDPYVRGFAMDHDLQQYPSVTSIWKCR